MELLHHLTLKHFERDMSCVFGIFTDGLVKRLEELEKTAELYKGFFPLFFTIVQTWKMQYYSEPVTT